jgi:uncharacterized protein YjiS (DUF1127 family)
MARSDMTTIAAALRPRLRLARLGGWLYLCWRRSRQRPVLAEFSDHQLRDIGLTRDDVRPDIERPPWR